MKRVLCLSSLVVLSSIPAPAPAAEDAAMPRPLNIVWIVADDLGYGDLGCYGAKDIPTPQLDALAAQGLCSTRFYAMPVCSPTRAALLTGRSPKAAGVETALMGGGGLPAGTVTAARLFQARGYRTALVGKWHLGYADASLPNAQGFDEFFGHLGGKLHYYEHTDELGGKERPDLWENDQPIDRAGTYTTTLFTDRACDFVRANRERPFFLMLSYNAPHYARGKKAGDTFGPDHYIQAPPEAIARVARDPKNPTLRELYAAAVNVMDEGIGRFLKTLDDEGLRERTLVIFLSDNGADTGHGGSSGPLSGHKAQLAEGGIRVAMMARLPGVIPAGRVVSAPADVRDVLVTSAALAGVKLTPWSAEGVDVSPAWRGQASDASLRCFAWQRERAVLSGPWKWHDTGDAIRLYNLERDPAERQNLADQYPEQVAELSAAWSAWSQTQEKPAP